MQSCTAAFLNEVQTNHKIVIVAEIWNNNTYTQTVYPLDGSVTVDARRAVRRNASIELIDEDGTLNPNLSTSVLTPYGTEIKLYRGVQYSDGTIETIPLGIFEVVSVRWVYGGEGLRLSVEMEDRSRIIMLKRFTSPYNVAASTNYATLLANLVTSRDSTISTSVTSTTFSSPAGGVKVLGIDSDNDPWNDVVSMAEGIGQEAYFDVYGVFTTTPMVRLVDKTPVISVSESTTGTLLHIDQSVSTDNIYNGVIAKAEGTHLLTPLETRVWDDATSSPTRRTGPLGERPFDWSSSWITSQAQLDWDASYILDSVRGTPVTFDMVPNPALDVRDVVTLSVPTLGFSANVVIDNLRIPLGADGSMQVNGRTVNV